MKRRKMLSSTVYICRITIFAIVVEVVMTALQFPREESTASFVKYGLWAISNLAAGNAANRAQLGELGACAGVFAFNSGRLS